MLSAAKHLTLWLVHLRATQMLSAAKHDMAKGRSGCWSRSFIIASLQIPNHRL